MPKSSQKAAGANESASQRGKSRFGTPGRQARVVLPERPPRMVDNEIVSILLGADPATLSAQAEEVKSVASAESVNSAPTLTVVEAPAPSDARPTQVLTAAGPTPAGDIEATAGSAQGASIEHTTIEDRVLTSESPVPVESVSALPLTAQSEVAAPTPTRARRTPSVPTARRASEDAAPAIKGVVSRDGTTSSFEDFAERWKHGLRKGQLKICEVLYQKTHAVGQTECVTSFSELGRLSGLKMRQCFNIIAQLEALRFVDRSRSEATSNKKDQGSVIRFHLYPVQ